MTEKTIQYSQDYDTALDQLPHYQAYPRMRPFVGHLYGHHGPKILLVAESHYLPRNSTLHLDAQRWYAGTEAVFSEADKPGWINTRDILNKPDGRWTAKGHTIYQRLNRALIEAGYPGNDNMFKYVAFMNGFQRPAVTGDSLKVHRQDLMVSREVLNGVIDVLKPDHVIFVSTKAKRHLAKHLEIESKGVPHPACAWWYRASKHGTGKERFISLMSSIYPSTEADRY
ncbi:hypothetical protein BTW08_05990 [Salinicola sp. MH3R3-1]|uniref:hypothetical protein n=1 Tax=Salinicola sp. MH3R3-1 TaxID=1928762 RepID=UPI00094E0048|nr:hypothetical protein [Salinicola sp. MH3R3-1]OLO08858.1 hypothetical protein BTW08_05990 [Salinicola sp. MH3R3-1]